MNKTVFTNNPLNRTANLRNDVDWIKSIKEDQKTKYIIFFNEKPLINPSSDHSKNSEIKLFDFNQLDNLLEKAQYLVFLGQNEGKSFFAVDLSNIEQIKENKNIMGESKFIDVRSIAPNLSSENTGILAQAKSMISWNNAYTYCTKCKGAKLETKEAGYKKLCNSCKTEFFPRVDPVVIMLPIYKDKCLLGRQKIFPPRMYSALAGFLEPGETIEDAVKREINEESGLTAIDVEYKFTQPWPFPFQLMIGCIANVENDVLKLDYDELEDAVWLSREDLNRVFVGKSPQRIWIPPAMAIAHQLIVHWMHS